MIGKRIADYELLKELGAGAMGRVYRAQGEDGLVAIKVLHPTLVHESDEYLERFRREAQLGLEVRHPNVVQTLGYDTFPVDGVTCPYLVMEYVEGQDLRGLLAEIGQVPERLCWHISRQIAEGLGAVHGAGAVHRDLKPENVLITRDHTVKVMDLGIAGLMDQAVSQALTAGFLGTAMYAAPEQILGEPLDPRADWYALGLVLFELATGRPTAQSSGVVALMHERLEKEPPRAGDLNPQLSPFLEEVVAGLLTREREGRLDHLPTEESDWWTNRTHALRAETKKPLRRIRIPRETALFGRDEELQTLGALFAKASAGEGQVVLLQGEAGIGKTRLVDEVVDGLDGELNFLFGANSPGGAATAAGAFVTAVRDQLEGTTSARYLQEVPALVPAFDALLRGDVAPTGEAKLNQEALQTAFVQIVRSFAEERPTIILIDDLHLAPVAGLALFAALAQALRGDRVLLIGTSRPTLDPDWSSQLLQGDNVQRMALDRLGAKEVGALLLGALGSQRLAEELAFQVLTKSDGNPFFVFEILRSLRDERYVTQNEGGQWVKQRAIERIVVPSSILDLVESRVADLSEDERELLEVAACDGFGFDPFLVAEALGLNKTPALKMLARLERKHRLVRSVGRQFVFDHQQIQSVLYEGIPELLREDHHANLGRALSKRAGDAPDGETAVRITEHLLRGADGEGARRHLDAALLHLASQYEHARVGELANQALAVPDLLTGEARFRVLIQRSIALEAVGRTDERLKVLEEAAAVAHELDDPALLADITIEWAKRAAMFGTMEESLDLAREAVEHARRAGDARRVARSLAPAGAALRQMGRLDESVVEWEAMREALEEAPDPLMEAHIVVELGRCRLMQGRDEGAKAEIEEAVGMYRRLGERQAEVVGWSILANAAWAAGDYDESLRCNEQMIAVLKTTGVRKHLGMAQGNLALVHLAVGHLTAAKEALEHECEIATEIGNARSEGKARLNLGSILLTLGDAGAARVLLDHGMTLLRRLNALSLLGHGADLQAELELQEGSPEDARPWAEEAVALRREQPQRDALITALLRLAGVHAAQGDRDGAAAHVDEALVIARELGQPFMLFRCHLAGARLLDRDPAPALAGWTEQSGRLAIGAELEIRYDLWKVSRDDAHLAAARERLATLVEHAPAENHETMLENVRLHREIQAAWAENEGMEAGRATSIEGRRKPHPS